MLRRTKLLILKYTIYALLVFFAGVLQTTPHFLEVFGVRPDLVVPLAVCIALFEDEVCAAAYGAFAGLVCDAGSFTVFGFNGLIVAFGCAAVALAMLYLMRQRLLNGMLLCAAVLTVRALLEYLFYFGIWEYAGTTQLLWRTYLPSVIYSTLTVGGYYFLVRGIRGKFDTYLRAA